MSTAQRSSSSSPAHASPIRQEPDDGVAYTVIPVTAQIEGIYQYSTTNGTVREFTAGEELMADLDRWDGLPLTLRHPIVNVDGAPQHGLTTGPQANYTTVGEFRRADRSTDTTLKGEAWIRDSEIGAHNGELETYLDAIRAGGYGSVSTGYDSTPVADPGSYHGERYDARQTRINPDHVALLPGAERGNCSIAAGCGVGRTNTQPAAAQADAEPRVNATMVSRTHALDSARTPTYSGTESQSWGDIPAGTLSHYTDNLSLESDDTGSWDDLTQSDRQTIAEHTLLGDSNADSTDEGIVFPVVNASTGSLNEGALDAVIGGRGSSANQPQSAIDSAQTRARSLLNDEFDREVSTNVDAHEESPASVDPGGLRAAARALADAVGLSVSGSPPDTGTTDDVAGDADSSGDGTDDAVRTNQSAGDAVQWDSSNGSDDEPDSVRYGVVVNDLSGDDEDEDSVLVAVYEPTDDGWVATDETEPISPESLTVSGNDGVDSLPTVDDARSNADVPVDASGDEGDGDGEAEAESESSDSDSDSDVDEAAESATGPQSAAESDADSASDTDIGPPASADSPNDTDGDGDSVRESNDGESAPDSRSDKDTESTAAADSDANSTSELMRETDTDTDKTTTLVEEHGFKAENLPDEDQDCFGRIYEQFATTNDDGGGSDGSDDRQAAASASDDDDADDDAPNDDNGGNDDDSNSNGDDADRDTDTEWDRRVPSMPPTPATISRSSRPAPSKRWLMKSSRSCRRRSTTK